MAAEPQHSLRLGIVGCGAVTELLHLPALARCPEWRVAVLADADPARAAALAASSGATVAAAHAELAGKVDAALVAVPNVHHAAVTVALLEQGIPVLVEKPMALTTADCDRMIAAAARSGATLAVGLGKRFFPAYRYVKRLLDADTLGAVRNFEFREGTVFNWQTATDAPFRREAGGGVLRDVGPHTLDLLLWWLGDVAEVACYDDAVGGVDADCELHLRLRSGAQGIVELSRTRNFRRYYRIEGARGGLEASADWNNPAVTVSLATGADAMPGPGVQDGAPQAAYADAIVAQWQDFAAAIRERRAPRVPGAEGRRAIALIEDCARQHRALPQPWRQPAATGAGARSP